MQVRFSKQAKARHGGDVHRNVHLNIGKVAEAEEGEELRLKAAMERASQVARWKARWANAILRPQSTITGKFADSIFTVNINPDGTVTGMGRLSPFGETIKGVLQGELVTFTWRTDASAAYAFERSKSGHGLAVLASKSRLEGQYGEGDLPIDSSIAENWKEFTLQKKP